LDLWFSSKGVNGFVLIKKKETVRRFLSGGQLLGCEKEDRQIMKKPTSRALTYRTGINFSSLSFLLFLKKRRKKVTH